MTKEEAEKLGYQVIVASPCEVGLIKGDMGIRTWWVSSFDGKLPGLDDPEIMSAIEVTEKTLNRRKGL